MKSPDEIEAEIEAAHADGKRSVKTEAYDRTTMIAFGLLFVLPAIIIVFSILFFLPFIARSIQEEPSGATTLPSNSRGLTPDNR